MRTLRFAPTALLVMLASCTDAPRVTISPTDAAPSMNTVSRVSVFGGGTYYAGTSTTMYAEAYDANNNLLFNAPLYWSSSNASVASPGGHGNSVAVSFPSVGYATIAVNSGGVYGYASVQVVAQPVVTSITITPSPASVTLGTTKHLIARAYDQYGQQMTVSGATWSSANTSIATVSSSGVVSGVGIGSTTVQVTIGGVSKTATVNVHNQLTVQMAGPYTISTDGQYTWTAAAAGGAGSYNYSWRVESGETGLPISTGTGSSFSMWVDSSLPSSLIVYVQVTSGTETASDQMGVCNFTASTMC